MTVDNSSSWSKDYEIFSISRLSSSTKTKRSKSMSQFIFEKNT